LTWWRTHLSVNARRWLAKLWPWLFFVCVIASLLLVIGSIILVYFFDVNNANFFRDLFFFVIGSLLLTVIAGFAYDVQNKENSG